MARLTITQAAVRLGISADAVRRRVRKGELPAERDNRSQWWVEVPEDAAAVALKPTVDDRIAGAMLAPAQHQHSATVAALQDQVDDLKARLDVAEGRETEVRGKVERQGRELTAATSRALIAETEMQVLRDVTADLRAERDGLLATVRQLTHERPAAALDVPPPQAPATRLPILPRTRAWARMWLARL